MQFNCFVQWLIDTDFQRLMPVVYDIQLFQVIRGEFEPIQVRMQGPDYDYLKWKKNAFHIYKYDKYVLGSIHYVDEIVEKG